MTYCLRWANAVYQQSCQLLYNLTSLQHSRFGGFRYRSTHPTLAQRAEAEARRADLERQQKEQALQRADLERQQKKQALQRAEGCFEVLPFCPSVVGNNVAHPTWLMNHPDFNSSLAPFIFRTPPTLA
jgi:hypothetical protein